MKKTALYNTYINFNAPHGLLMLGARSIQTAIDLFVALALFHGLGSES